MNTKLITSDSHCLNEMKQLLLGSRRTRKHVYARLLKFPVSTVTKALFNLSVFPFRRKGCTIHWKTSCSSIKGYLLTRFSNVQKILPLKDDFIYFSIERNKILCLFSAFILSYPASCQPPKSNLYFTNSLITVLTFRVHAS